MWIPETFLISILESLQQYIQDFTPVDEFLFGIMLPFTFKGMVLTLKAQFRVLHYSLLQLFGIFQVPPYPSSFSKINCQKTCTACFLTENYCVPGCCVPIREWKLEPNSQTSHRSVLQQHILTSCLTVKQRLGKVCNETFHPAKF